MEFEYLLALQSVRESAPDIVNQFFILLSAFVVSPAPVVLVGLIYWCVDKRAGYLMVGSYVSSCALNAVFKNTLCVTRPWVLDSRIVPDATALPGATGYSFPSGHTTVAASLFGSIALWLRKHAWAVVLCVALVLLTAFSRNWLGVHTPKDVVAGILLGVISVAAVNLFINLLDEHPSWDLPLGATIVVLSAVALAYCANKGYPAVLDASGNSLVDVEAMKTDCFTNLGSFMAFGVAMVIDCRLVKFTVDGSVKTRVLRGVVGVAIVAVYFLVIAPMGIKPFFDDHWYHFIKYSLLIIALMVVYPACVMAVRRRHS